jgi:hypothetical protein
MCVSTAAHVTVQGPHYDMDITEVPHIGTLEMVVSPTALVDGQALYGADATAPVHSVSIDYFCTVALQR